MDFWKVAIAGFLLLCCLEFIRGYSREDDPDSGKAWVYKGALLVAFPLLIVTYKSMYG